VVDVTDIVTLAPDADLDAAASVVRVLNSRHKLRAAATCRGGHLHVLTSLGLFLGDPSLAYEEAAKGQIGGAVIASTGPDEVTVAILAWGGVQPPHRFRATEGLALARRINELVGQPPEGPPVTPAGRGRVTTRPRSWRMPGMSQAGDECQVSVVSEGIQLYFSSGAYPMSTVFGRDDLLGLLPGDNTTLVFRSHEEILEVELEATPNDIATIIPDLETLEDRPLLSQRQPILEECEPEQVRDGLLTPEAPGSQREGPLGSAGVNRNADDSITTRDGLVIQRVLVPGADAEERWAELTRIAETARQWPVILGNPLVRGFDELTRLLDDMASDRARPAKDLLADAEALDVRVVLDRRWDETLPIDEDEDDQEAMEVFDESLPPGPVPPIPAPLTPTSGTATIALVPAAAGEDVLAVLGWGDWDACPPPEEHVTVLREWRRRYGAVVKAISPDTLELAVERPPASFDDALVLAREQYAYAPDIVDQGEHPSIGALAAALVDGRRWHFWWD
jgi:hypothetical protein